MRNSLLHKVTYACPGESLIWELLLFSAGQRLRGVNLKLVNVKEGSQIKVKNFHIIQ